MGVCSSIPTLRAALSTLLAQNLILLGLFFTIPLYLQVVHGLDAFQTGLRLLPVSVTMLVTAMSAPLLNRSPALATVVRMGFACAVRGHDVAHRHDPRRARRRSPSPSRWRVLGIGMGLLAAQLGNVAQSSVGDAERSEVGGLQYTAQNLGSSLGTALIGSIVVLALTSAALAGLRENPQVSDAVEEQVGTAVAGSVSFVPVPQIRQALEDAGIPPDQVEAITAGYAEAQLLSLKIALLAAAAIALASLFLARGLPRERLGARPRTSADKAAAVRGG